MKHAALALLVALAFLAGLAIGYGDPIPREVVCDDDVEFRTFDVPYAVQATCRGGITVTLLD